MVRITIRHVRAGVATASSVALVGNAGLGCALTQAEQAERVESNASSATAVDPGTGVFDLQPTYAGATGPTFLFNTTGTTDEFVRVGESITLTAPAWVLSQLVETSGVTPDVAMAEAYRITFHVELRHAGAVVERKDVRVTSFTGQDFYSLVAHSQSFVIPARTDAIAIGLTVIDPSQNDKKAEVTLPEVREVPVFGGEGKRKHLVFDNSYGTLRERVVEGGNPKAGADAVVTYTDWRADTLVDKGSIDREIGTATGYTRFGSYDMPIFGDVVYEIAYGAAFDDVWAQEQVLAATTTSRVLPLAGRTAYEADLALLPSARKMDLYFHVKAILVVDYARWGNVTSRRYGQGDRIVVRERWDNLHGQAGQNYDFPVDRR
jgi:hypothetical protein